MWLKLLSGFVSYYYFLNFFIHAWEDVEWKYNIRYSISKINLKKHFMILFRKMTWKHKMFTEMDTGLAIFISRR